MAVAALGQDQADPGLARDALDPADDLDRPLALELVEDKLDHPRDRDTGAPVLGAGSRSRAAAARSATRVVVARRRLDRSGLSKLLREKRCACEAMSASVTRRLDADRLSGVPGQCFGFVVPLRLTVSSQPDLHGLPLDTLSDAALASPCVRHTFGKYVENFRRGEVLKWSSSRERLRRGAVALPLHWRPGAAMVAISAGASGAKVTASAAASSRPANKIQILVYGDAQNTAEQYAVQQYNKTPMGKQVKAVLTTIPGANYQTKLQTIMSTSSAPDVFFNWGGGSIAQFQKAGLLLPLNGFMQKPTRS